MCLVHSGCQGPLFIPTTLLPGTLRALHSLASLPGLLLPRWGHPSACLAVLPTDQAYSYLRTFACAAVSAWNALPQISAWPLPHRLRVFPRCHPLSKASPDSPVGHCSLPFPYVPFPALFFSVELNAICHNMFYLLILFTVHLSLGIGSLLFGPALPQLCPQCLSGREEMAGAQ